MQELLSFHKKINNSKINNNIVAKLYVDNTITGDNQMQRSNIFEILFRDTGKQVESIVHSYIELIKKADEESRTKLPIGDKNYVYLERHHILPKSLYSEYKNDSNNIILLTAREHYVAHKLLVQIFPCDEMTFCFWRLSTDNHGREVTEDEYECAKRLVAVSTSHMNSGRVYTEAQRKAMGDRRRGRKHTEETKSKISCSHIGMVASTETREKMSENRRGKGLGRVMSDEHKETLRNRMSGDDNPMKKVQGGVRGYMSDEEYIAYTKKLSESLMGHPVSEETKRKIGEKSKGRISGGKNPKAKKIRCVEDNVVFSTLSECGSYYNLSRTQMTNVAKTGYSKEINKHFIIEK